MTFKARHTTYLQINAYQTTCAESATNHYSIWQSHQENWFHSLPIQQFQALLTLFPKSFSPFPHGTFMLSVSSPYLALDEIYHPFALQSQGTWLVGGTPYVSGCQRDGTLTLPRALFQETYTGTATGRTPKDYKSTTSGRFSSWALPSSVALTEGILVSFSSSAYWYA